MSNIDQWAAEQCGVDLNEWLLLQDGHSEWTLQDARCREIVREHFRIDTYQEQDGKWACSTPEREWGNDSETIAEAELACIQAIYEASND